MVRSISTIMSAFCVCLAFTGCGEIEVHNPPAAGPTIIEEKKVIERPTVIEKKTEIELPGKKTEVIEKK